MPVSVPDRLVKGQETAVVHRPGSPLDGLKVLVTRDEHLNPECHVMVRPEQEDWEDLINGGFLVISFKNDGVPDFTVVAIPQM